MLAAIELAIGDRSSASVSYTDFGVRLAALAREVGTCRRFEKPLEAKQVKPPLLSKGDRQPKPVTVARPRHMPRRVPSLPAMPWQNDDGSVILCHSYGHTTGKEQLNTGVLKGEPDRLEVLCDWNAPPSLEVPDRSDRDARLVGQLKP